MVPKAGIEPARGDTPPDFESKSGVNQRTIDNHQIRGNPRHSGFIHISRVLGPLCEELGLCDRRGHNLGTQESNRGKVPGSGALATRTGEKARGTLPPGGAVSPHS